MSYYLLEFTSDQQMNYHIYNNLFDIKTALVESLFNIQSFIQDFNVYLYIVYENQLIMKYNIKSWVHILIEDIDEVTFTDVPIETFLSLDEGDKEIIDELSQMLLITNTLVSNDLSKIQLITELRNLNVDGFDMISIDINYPQLPDVQFNINSHVNFPKDWRELPPKLNYTCFEIAHNSDTISLNYGCNKN